MQMSKTDFQNGFALGRESSGVIVVATVKVYGFIIQKKIYIN